MLPHGLRNPGSGVGGWGGALLPCRRRRLAGESAGSDPWALPLPEPLPVLFCAALCYSMLYHCRLGSGSIVLNRQRWGLNIRRKHLSREHLLKAPRRDKLFPQSSHFPSRYERHHHERSYSQDHVCVEEAQGQSGARTSPPSSSTIITGFIAEPFAGMGRGSRSRSPTHGHPMQDACFRRSVLQLSSERAGDHSDLTAAQCAGATILSSPAKSKQAGSQTSGSWYVPYFRMKPQHC